MLRVLMHFLRGSIMTIDRAKRKNQVLEAVIETHIDTALPVGSNYIVKMLGLSSATIRGVMFELEKEGCLYHPHTSAGRIPTDLGYRRYVDNIRSRELDALSEGLCSRIKNHLHKLKVLEEIIEESSHVMSEITNYTAVAILPQEKLYLDGAYHMFEQPEFREFERMRDFLRVMEEKKNLLGVLRSDLDYLGTRIRIGREIALDGLEHCTVITTSYKINNQPAGNLGVIGPMRMKYEKIVPLVEEIASFATEMLERI